MSAPSSAVAAASRPAVRTTSGSTTSAVSQQLSSASSAPGTRDARQRRDRLDVALADLACGARSSSRVATAGRGRGRPARCSSGSCSRCTGARSGRPAPAPGWLRNRAWSARACVVGQQHASAARGHDLVAVEGQGRGVGRTSPRAAVRAGVRRARAPRPRPRRPAPRAVRRRPTARRSPRTCRAGRPVITAATSLPRTPAAIAIASSRRSGSRLPSSRTSRRRPASPRCRRRRWRSPRTSSWARGPRRRARRRRRAAPGGAPPVPELMATAWATPQRSAISCSKAVTSGPVGATQPERTARRTASSSATPTSGGDISSRSGMSFTRSLRHRWAMARRRRRRWPRRHRRSPASDQFWTYSRLIRTLSGQITSRL